MPDALPSWAGTPDIVVAGHSGAIHGISFDEYRRLKIIGLSLKLNETTAELQKVKRELARQIVFSDE